MRDPKLKLFAVTATIKPLSTGNVRYQSKLYRGWALAKNPNEAKELTKQTLINGFDPSKEPRITREVITIKDCKLHDDFYAQAK